MRYVPIGVAFLACVAAFAFALVMLGGVLSGAAHDARLLADVNPWLLLLFPGMWLVVWIVGRGG